MAPSVLLVPPCRTNGCTGERVIFQQRHEGGDVRPPQGLVGVDSQAARRVGEDGHGPAERGRAGVAGVPRGLRVRGGSARVARSGTEGVVRRGRAGMCRVAWGRALPPSQSPRARRARAPRSASGDGIGGQCSIGSRGSECETRLGSRHTLADIDQIWAAFGRFGADPAQNRPMPTNMRSSSARLCRAPAWICRIRSKISGTGPHFRVIRQHAPAIAPDSVDSGLNLADNGRNCIKIGRRRPNVADICAVLAVFGQSWTGFGRCGPCIWQTLAELDGILA